MKPDNIFLVRHGQSIGNVSRTIYKDVPDYALQLTDLGHTQADLAGQQLSKLIDSPLQTQFYVSPFWRSRQTFIHIQKYFSNFKYYEDPRLREQEWSHEMTIRTRNSKISKYRDNYGPFYYRFNDGGESCADVFDRISDFLNTMYRDFAASDFGQNVIIVMHGMSMRLFLMRFFHCSVEEFESWANPKNCEFFHLRRCKTTNKYFLLTPLRTHTTRHNFQFNWKDTSVPQLGAPKLSTVTG